MNFLGVISALVAFLSIWFGHVAVRKIEFISPKIWLPSLVFAALGLLVGFASLSTSNRSLSVALGILAITLLFDALELRRQQNRVRRGHAPANADNPRHVRILAEYPSATTFDLLKREPGQHTLSAEQTPTHL